MCLNYVLITGCLKKSGDWIRISAPLYPIKSLLISIFHQPDQHTCAITLW